MSLPATSLPDRPRDPVVWVHPLDPLQQPVATPAPDGHASLPLPAAPAPWSNARTAASEPVMQRHIVVIDDAPEVCALLSDVFQSEGYRVSAFALPPSRDALAGIAPDLIVLDLLYQGQPTGLESIAALRADARFQMLPIVVCTGASDIVGRRDEELATLDVGVVLKPFDIETLLTETARRLQAASFTEMAGGPPEPVRRGDGRISETG